MFEARPVRVHAIWELNSRSLCLEKKEKKERPIKFRFSFESVTVTSKTCEN